MEIVLISSVSQEDPFYPQFHSMLKLHFHPSPATREVTRQEPGRSSVDGEVFFRLKYSCFIMMFLVYSKVIPLYIYTYVYIFFSHIGYYKILNIVPCAIQ